MVLHYCLSLRNELMSLSCVTSHVRCMHFMLKITVRCTCTTMHVEDPVCRVLCVSRCFVHLKQEGFLRKMSWNADTQMLWNHAASIIYTDWMSRAVPCKDVFTLTAIHSIEATGSHSFSVTADYVRATFDNTSVLSDIMNLSLSRNYGCTILWKNCHCDMQKKNRFFVFVWYWRNENSFFFCSICKMKNIRFFSNCNFLFFCNSDDWDCFFAIFVIWKNTGFFFL